LKHKNTKLVSIKIVQNQPVCKFECASTIWELSRSQVGNQENNSNDILTEQD